MVLAILDKLLIFWKTVLILFDPILGKLTTLDVSENRLHRLL